MRKAYITAHHHIQTDDGWMTARQADDRGHGTFLSDHVYLKFYSLRLVVGGNIIINTSASPDQTPTQIEAAPMGYCFLPSAKFPNTNTPTYPRQEAGPKDSRAAQAQLSYCQVAQRHPTGISGWPTLQSVPLAPKTTARLESKTVTEGGAREHKGEPNIGSMGLPATTQLDPRTGQRLSEEYGGNLDTFLKVADTLRPEGPLQILGDSMPGDGFVQDVDICCTYPARQATKDPVRGNNGSKADLNSSRDTATATDLRHATMPATHIISPLQKGKLAPTTIPPPKTDTEIEHLSTTTQETGAKTPKLHHNPNLGIQTDIYLQTPTGECVPVHEVQWALTHMQWYAAIVQDSWVLYLATTTSGPALQRQPSAPLQKPTSARSSTKLPLQESQVPHRNRHGH